VTRRGRKIDLAAGILLGLVLGLVIAYLLVVVVGGSRDASEISTTTTTRAPQGEARSRGPARQASPEPPSQRR
jgi:hypothetical protein